PIAHRHAISRAPPLFLCLPRPPPRSSLFPYTTLFRSVPFPPWQDGNRSEAAGIPARGGCGHGRRGIPPPGPGRGGTAAAAATDRSEEHTSELQSRFDLVCRLLLEKKKKNDTARAHVRH